MILGLSLGAFTLLHVLLSLVGIATGLLTIAGLMTGKVLKGWTGLFLITTELTSITGFLFPFKVVTPGIILGVLSLIALIAANVALYAKKLEGGWHTVYAVTATVAEYFNVFVLVAQLFAKVPVLTALAPTPASPVFGATQLLVLALFVVLGVKAVKGTQMMASSYAG